MSRFLQLINTTSLSWRHAGSPAGYVLAAIAGLGMLVISGCAPTTATSGNEPEPETEDVEPISAPAEAGGDETPTVSTEPVSELTPELLYDVLLAAVANQRQEPEVALDALVRAVYQSRDRRLNANAIELALHVGDYQQAIDLSRLLLSLDPGNFRATLALATAEMRNDMVEDAATTLLDLVRAQEIGREPILQEVASFIARQEGPARDLLRARLEGAAEAGDPIVVFTAALLASRLEEPERFRELLEQALASEPDWETAAILKLTDISDRERDQLDAWATEWIDAHQDAERFRVLYARLLIQDERLDEALAQFDAVLTAHPESRDAMFAAAVVNLDMDNDARAEELLRRYIRSSDNGDQARLYLAQLFIEQERYEDASPLLRQIQSNQFYLDAQIALSGVIAHQSNVEAGLSYLRSIDTHGEDESVRLILEQDLLLRDFDQMDRSLELLTEALEERPEQPDLLYSRGLLAAQLNRLELIEKDMRLLIELQPENAHAYNALGYTLADQTDRYEEALDLISKALEFLPEDPYILDSMGWVQYRLGDIDQALDYLQQAWEIKKDAEIAAHLGEVLWMMGREDEAWSIWQEGREAGPENATLLKTIDRFAGEAGDQRAVLAPPAMTGLPIASPLAA